MRNLILNSGATPAEPKECLLSMDNGIPYWVESIENQFILGYVVDYHVLPSTGWYMYDRNLGGYAEVTGQDGNEVTEYYRQNYEPTLSSSATVYECELTTASTTYNGYHIVYSGTGRGEFCANWNSERSRFDIKSTLLVATEDDALYGGDYHCTEETISITGVTLDNGFLLDGFGKKYNHAEVSLSNFCTTAGHGALNVAYNEEWEKVGDGKYVCDNDYFRGEFPEEGYAVYIYSDEICNYFPGTYCEEAEEVTVTTSAGTQTVLDGKLIIFTLDGVEVHGFIHNGTSYYRDDIYTGTTFENMVWWRRGSMDAYPFIMEHIESSPRGNVMNTIVPGVAYRRDERKVFYNGKGPMIYRVNDGNALFSIKERTYTFVPDALEWTFKHSYPYMGHGDFSLGVKPQWIESLIINRQEYKPTVDTGEWVINLVYNCGLYNPDTEQGIYDISGEGIKVTFTEDFFKNGTLYCLYSSHAS